MQISISLPETPYYECTNEEDEGDYQSIKHFLRQLELSVHHAQKSLEEIKKMNEELDDPQELHIAYRVSRVEYPGDEEVDGIPGSIEIEIYA